MLALVLVIAVPVVAYFCFRKGLPAFCVSAPIGAMVLIGNMIYMESNNPRGDFDFVFAFGCVMWGVIITCVYGACFALIGICRMLALRSTTAKD